MRNIFLLSFYSVLLCSCLPEDLLIDVEPAPSQIVVASQILPGDVMAIFLSRSFSALEGNEDSLSQDFLNSILVEDALVTLSINGELDTLEEVEDTPGLFFALLPEKINGAHFELQVHDSQFGVEVSASTVSLPQIIPDSIAFLEEIQGADTVQSIYYDFEDPQNAENWYLANFIDAADLLNNLETNLFSFVGEESGLVFDRLITDQTNTTGTIETLVELDEIATSDTLTFWFTHITEDYFRFLDARRRTGGIIAAATSEPISLPGNVEGGLGFFNAQIPYIRAIPKTSR